MPIKVRRQVTDVLQLWHDGAVSTLVISYSRLDRPQVRAIVGLLRTAYKDIDQAVYWDEDCEPGEPWFEQLGEHLDATQQLFVFWCGHSSVSTQVRRELTYALEHQKRIVPVLLDDTALSPELPAIQVVNLRGAIVHLPELVPLDDARERERHGDEEAPRRRSSGWLSERVNLPIEFPRGWRGLSLVGVAVAAVALNIVEAIMFSQRLPLKWPVLFLVVQAMTAVILVMGLRDARRGRALRRLREIERQRELEQREAARSGDPKIIDEASVVRAFAPHLS